MSRTSTAAPRLGVAYRLNARSVVRAGYGITFNPLPLARPLRGSFPLTIAADFQDPNNFQPFNRIEQGIPEFCCPDLSAGVVPLPPTAIIRTPGLGLLKRGYIQSWNLVVERRLPREFVTSVGYVGTQTTRGFFDLDINAAAPGTGIPGRPAFAAFGRAISTSLLQGGVNANYHSLQATVHRRLTGGLLLRAAYTFSRAINWADDDGGVALLWNPPSVLHRNRAQAGYNIPHNFQLGAVYELPFGKRKPVLGGWQLSGAFGAFQGRPFTVTSGGASLNAPGNAQTADQVLSNVTKLGPVGSGARFYDPEAFRAVTQVRFGTSGRNLLRGPGVVNANVSLFKAFRIAEQFQLTFRAEAFNLANTPHFANPAANATDRTSFFAITVADPDERQFRFGLRLGF